MCGVEDLFIQNLGQIITIDESQRGRLLLLAVSSYSYPEDTIDIGYQGNEIGQINKRTEWFLLAQLTLGL